MSRERQLSDRELKSPAYKGPLTLEERMAMLWAREVEVGMEAVELRTFREGLGMSRDEMAAALGVHWQTIGNWERPGASVPVEQAARIRLLQPVGGGLVRELAKLEVGEKSRRLTPEEYTMDTTPVQTNAMALYKRFKSPLLRGRWFELALVTPGDPGDGFCVWRRG